MEVLIIALLFYPIVYISVAVHELIHYLLAKVFGLKVKSFSVGKGKVLFQTSFLETEINLKLNPLRGGCVFIDKEEIVKRISTMPIIFIASPITNLLIGIVLGNSEYTILQFVGMLNMLMFLISIAGSDGLYFYRFLTQGVKAIPVDEIK